MKFADCEVLVREKNSEKTFSEIPSLERFIPFAPNGTARTFTFDVYEIRLEGIPEDFKVYFGVGDERTLVGEQVYGSTHRIYTWAYDQMMAAVEKCCITF